ncbi:putative olfactory receptor 13C6 [Gadus morhua]|uniref:putative olfactory receptor 13C6 n=1 Tax=Gadus morhua TaxID=8049 RepID=UPI0011B6756B|nr:putative olfactory receptor 13C6 [Gadus morhua]
MENLTFNADIFFLEGLKVTPQSSFPAFILLLIIYIFIMVSNISLTALICLDRSLHQPMYLLFCNMSINDVFGASTIIPRLLSDIFILTKDRYITYKECVIQAFCAHFHAGTSHSVLMVMAFDRYVAICNPLHYAAIMTNKMVLKLTLLAWFLALGSVVILIGLNVRLSRCKRAIFNPFCDNASLFKLSCDNIIINHIYGLTFTVVLFSSSIGSMVLTYAKITAVCLTSKNKALNSKALRTCRTHLFVYLIIYFRKNITILPNR